MDPDYSHFWKGPLQQTLYLVALWSIYCRSDGKSCGDPESAHPRINYHPPAHRNDPHLTGPLAYSPDGRYIACASNTATLIWDIQTGGVAKEIKCSPNNISLLWSLDGRTIGAIDSNDQATFIVHISDVSSGTASSPGTFESGDIPHLWTDDESFWVMTTVRDRYDHHTIDIFEVGSTLTRIQSFSPRLSGAKIGSFSPATHRISASTGNTLHIFDIQNSQCLLEKTRHFVSHCFFSDGSYFAASQEGVVYIWKYARKWYTLLTEFWCQGLFNSLRFSPTPSSILGYPGDILRVWRLHEFSTAFETRRQYVGLSRSGTRVATAREEEKAVTVIDSLLTQAPPQIIDTGVGIQGLVLTGNVLLVAGSNKLTAWLFTEEGLVDGVIGDGMVGHSDSIWAVPLPLPRGDSWMFLVKGQVGVIKQMEICSTSTTQTLGRFSIPPKHFITSAVVGTIPLRHFAARIISATTICLGVIHHKKTVGEFHEPHCERGG